MSKKEYVLLATDGFIEVASSDALCEQRRRKVLVYSYVGGLYKVDGIVQEGMEYLDYKNPSNYEEIYAKRGTGKLPSPIIYGEVSDDIYVTLINIGMKYVDIMDNHTIHFHGAHLATQLDGFPELSAGVPMWMRDMETGELSAPPVLTYYYKAEHPGTYEYHCHVEASEHIQMGMYGAFFIYPSMKSLCEAGIMQAEDGTWLYHDMPLECIPKTATNRNFAYNDFHSYFDVEYNMLLSDIDINWHDSILYGYQFNPIDYKPSYFLVNGRAFPDTLLPHEDTVEGEPNYESYVHAKTGEKILLRFTNLSYQAIPWHIHGWHFVYVAKDTTLSPFLKMASMLHDKSDNLAEKGFTLNIAVGETYDIILNTDDKRHEYRKYIVDGQDGYPSFCAQLNEVASKDREAIAEIPTEPVICSDPNKTNYIDICKDKEEDNFFPQFYPMHNHEDYKNTNNGVYPGGHLTYIQIDKPNEDERYRMCNGHHHNHNGHH